MIYKDMVYGHDLSFAYDMTHGHALIFAYDMTGSPNISFQGPVTQRFTA